MPMNGLCLICNHPIDDHGLTYTTQLAPMPLCYTALPDPCGPLHVDAPEPGNELDTPPPVTGTFTVTNEPQPDDTNESGYYNAEEY